MFGEEFIMEKDAFKILVLSTVVNSGFGATGFFLNMTKHEKEFFFIMLASASLNVVLNLILIPIYGIYGAAASSLITVLIWNSMATLFIKKQFGYTLLFMPR
jgi:O-antigen/teichoic acid export membrane protein